MNDTIKRHPRTLNEAFPSGTDYARSVEHHRRLDLDGLYIVAFGVLVAVGIVAAWLLA